MRKKLLLVTLSAAFAMGHHGYSEYDRESAVALEGTVEHVLWGNPHVVLTIQIENKGEYSVEWGSVWQLARWGITAPPVKQGDRVIVTGSINRNPERHILTLVREISRPADGWRWTDARYLASK